MQCHAKQNTHALVGLDHHTIVKYIFFVIQPIPFWPEDYLAIENISTDKLTCLKVIFPLPEILK